MNLTLLIANDDNTAACAELREQEKELSKMEETYKNISSPLNKAQEQADNYMMMKQRVPMAIEYYKCAPSENPDYIERIEMYINPQRLQIQTQKLKGKAYTRGGIFYHHWGDDHWTMTLSGTVGLSGMKGIEQLEKIYHHSGALLAYTELGPDTVWTGGSEKAKTIDFNKPYEVIDFVFGNEVNEQTVNDAFKKCQQIANDIKRDKSLNGDQQLASQQKLYELISKMISGYKNIIQQAKVSSECENIDKKLRTYIENNKTKSISFEKLYQQAQSYINSSSSLKSLNEQLKILIGFDLSKNLFEDLNQYINKSFTAGGLNYDALNSIDSSLFGSSVLSSTSSTEDTTISSDVYDLQESMAQNQITVFKDYIKDIYEFNKNATINREQAQGGWADIRDELEDKWRPRQVFIYFEDRVYIGHFDSFSYQRQAESPLINYEMRLTIIRQIHTTTNDPSKAPVQTSTNSSSTVNVPIDSNAKYAGKPNVAKVEILRLKDKYAFENQIDVNSPDKADDFDIWEKETYINDIYSIATQASIDTKDPTYGTTINISTVYDLRLKYYTLFKTGVLDGTYTLTPTEMKMVKERANYEVKRSKEVYDKELATGKMTEIRKNQIKNWVKQVCDAAGNPKEVPNPFLSVSGGHGSDNPPPIIT